MSKYLNGIFFQKREGQYGEYFSIGITEEGLKALQELPMNDKKIRNITASPQKADPNKYSIKPYVGKEKDSTDSLPF